MKLRTPLLLGTIIGFVSCFSFQASAQTLSGTGQTLPTAKVEIVWHNLDPNQKQMVDLLAADFFEKSLSVEQRLRIMSAGARNYVAGSADQRRAFREKRRQAWQQLSPDQRQGLARAASGSWYNLTEKQKAPFRRYAIDQLGIKPVARPARNRSEA